MSVAYGVGPWTVRYGTMGISSLDCSFCDALEENGTLSNNVWVQWGSHTTQFLRRSVPADTISVSIHRELFVPDPAP